ncbi:Ros/MucR family transcriptional regulator [Novosphingobium gossypii]|uniref:MucR family transcriptional regulator n=1 Tax=Novosphingobium gossypii TaxID=1604774 RepID=UPI003D23400D
MPETEITSDIAGLTVQLLSAYLSNNTVAAEDIAGLIRTTRAALVEDAAPASAEPEVQTYTPAVSVRKSLSSPDHILSLIDGKPYKTLKRHLASNGLTPQQYRERYSLPASYPMVAPTFTARRREIAEQIGLGNRKQLAGKAAAAAEETTNAEVAKESAPATAPTKRSAPTKSKPAKAPAKADAPASTSTASASEPVKATPSKTAAKAKTGKPTAAKASAKKVDAPVAAAASTPDAAKAKPAAKSRGKLGLFKGKEAKPASEQDEAKATAAPADADATKATAKPARAKRMARAPRNAAPADKAE